MPLLQKRYIDTGKVKYIYRPMVDNVEEKNSRLAAEALYCAGDQDKFWELHDWMFLNIERWGQDPNLIGSLESTAGPALGLDLAPFRDCLETEKYRDHVVNLTGDAEARGIPGTPAFLVNDTLLVSPDYTMLRQAIEGQVGELPGLQLLLAIGMPAFLGLFLLTRSGSQVGPRVLLLRMIIAGLALLGLLIAAYQALYELQISGNLFCPIGQGCPIVNRSSYVRMLGVPIGVLGVFGYSLILVITLARLKQRRLWRIPLTTIHVVLSGVGFLFSLYLTYLEVFQIRALCSWCLVSALLLTGILGLSIAALVLRERKS